MNQTNQLKRTMTRILLAFMLILTGYAGFAQSVDIRQAENGNANNVGNVTWIESNLGSNNSIYYEGMAVPQRIIADNLPNQVTHTILLKHQAKKGTKHGYDFLTSWEMAQFAAEKFRPSKPLLSNLNAYDDVPNNKRSAVNSILASGAASGRITIVPPANITEQSVATRKSAFESLMNTLKGGSPIPAGIEILSTSAVSGGSLEFLRYEGGDSSAVYTLSWTTTSASNSAIIKFAGHLASSVDFFTSSNYTQVDNIGWGASNGAGSISGSSFHINVKEVDGSSVGSQDNQITSVLSVDCSSFSLGTPTVTNVTCNGANNGSITLSVSGGATPYSYSWTGTGVSGNTTSSISNLSPGTYAVTVVDGGGVGVCQRTGSFNITQPTDVTLSGDATDVKCNTGNDGSVTLTADGGVGNYSYKLGSGAYQSSATFSGLTAGNYTFTVKDGNDCTETVTVEVKEPSDVTLSGDATDVKCNTGNDGSVTLTADGGVGNYSYKLGSGAYQSSATFSGLTAGNYTFTVKDGNDCTETVTVEVKEPSDVTLSGDATDVKCNTGNDGSVTLTADGGVGNYEYKLGSGAYQSSATFSGLTAGNYTFTVKDGNDCTETVTVEVKEPSDVTLSGDATDVKCNTGNDGSVTLTADGGVGNYEYKLGSGAYQSSATFSGLTAGNYTFTVKDGNDCTETVTVEVKEPSDVTLSGDATDVKCNTGNDGSVTLTADGGVGNYSYKLGSGAYQSSATFSGLTAGNYTFTVKDGNDCTETVTVEVKEPSDVTLSGDATDVKCNTGNDGSVTLTADGGVGNYEYKLGSGAYQSSATFSGLTAGNYTFTVKDGNDCTETVTVEVKEPSDVTLSGDATDVKCNTGNDGSVTLTADGGVGNYEYKLGSGAYQSSATFSGLTAGNYTFTVKDGNDCTETVTVEVKEPSDVTLSGDATDVKCNTGNDGSVTLTADGGVGNYEYKLGSGAYQSSATFSGLTAGNYTFTVKDGNDCTETVTVEVKEPSAPVSASANTTATECAGTKTGSITLTVSGGSAPYQYNLNGGTLSNLPANGIIASLQAGNYTVYVQDAKGCNVTIQGNVTVAEGPVCYPYYTYSQGYYGNTNGNGVACIRGVGGLRTRDFMKRSLENGGGMTLGNASGFNIKASLTAGIAGTAVLDNILKVMPGGGSANFLIASIDLTSSYSATNKLLKNGKFNNVLIGQTVAMWMNVNIPGNELGLLDLIGLKCKTNIITKEPSSASSCNIPYAGTTEVSTAFPQSVVNALILRKATKGGTTVRDLVDMASEALGQSNKTIYNASLTDINAALDAIVNAFHGGKYFARFDGAIANCTPPQPATSKINVASPVEEAAAVKVEASNDAVVVKAFPNPYIDQVTFNVTVKNAGKGSLVIYNMVGQKVANVFEGNMQANSTQTIRYNVPFAQRKNLVYVFRQNDITNTGKLVSGK